MPCVCSAQTVLSSEKEEVIRCISSGQRCLRRVRWKIGMTMFFVGILMVVGYDAGTSLAKRDLSTYRCGHTSYSHLLFCFNYMCYRGRLIIFSLAPLADDVWVTRLMLMSELFVLLQSLHVVLPDFRHPPTEIAVPTVCFGLMAVNIIVFMACIVWAMLYRCAAKMQDFMWSALFWNLIPCTLIEIAVCVDLAIDCGSFPAVCWDIPMLLLSLYVCRARWLREGLHARLHRFFEARTWQRGAAGIAALVGKCPAKQVLQQAIGRFRAVHLSDLSFADIADNRPNAALSALTFPVKLHQCDAFLSHSWHDDPAAKWRALQTWREEFVCENGSEPTVWFDKCCIDQNNIEADLRCLPIFLSGCKKLVVLCGPTYLSRLWCIVELFTWVHIGRSLEEVEFVELHRSCLDGLGDAGGDDKGGATSKSRHDVLESFNTFDANRCHCSRQQDKDRMLCIIKAAFGSIEAFNEVIQQTFGAGQCQRTATCTRLVWPSEETDDVASSSPASRLERASGAFSDDPV